MSGREIGRFFLNERLFLVVEFALFLTVFLLALVTLFQVALALGAPLGEWAFGGQNKGRLPLRFRVTSALSVGVYALIAIHYLMPWYSQEAVQVVNWLLVGFNSLSLVMNTITRSTKERSVWAPIALLLLASSFVLALN